MTIHRLRGDPPLSPQMPFGSRSLFLRDIGLLARPGRGGRGHPFQDYLASMHSLTPKPLEFDISQSFVRILSGSLLRKGLPHTMFSSKLRVGIVGAGYFGNVHAKTYLDLENVDLVGIADKNLDRATALCKKYHCQPFSDGSELIGKVDAASIVVPASAHSKIAEPFLQLKFPFW